MATEPNTTIKLYSGIPFSVNYEHTMYFANATAQASFFAGFTPLSFTEQSYQRVNKNTLRIQASAESLMSYNYMSITNNNHGGRTYYAFIVDVPAYINENTCEITYEIDVIQSYLFHYTGVNNRPDITVKDCFIEREHSNTDGIGDNIVTEPVGLGEYVFANYDELPEVDLNDCYTILGITEVDSDKNNHGTVYDSVYGGLTLYAFDTTNDSGVEELNSWLGDNYTQKPDSVVSLYMCPKLLLSYNNAIDPTTHKVLRNYPPYQKVISTIPETSPDDNFGGYLPLNNKLYTYPYNFLHVDNGEGEALSLRYEFFALEDIEGEQHRIPRLLLNGCFSQPVNLTLSPTGYKGQVNKYNPNHGYPYETALYTEMLSLSNFPLCSWSSDSWNTWVAQNTIPSVLNVISGIGNLGVSSVYSAHPEASLGTGILGTITGLLSDIYSASIKADVCRGKVNNAGGGIAYRTKKFFYGRCHINRKDAEIIDDFFSVYGYATNLIKVPNLFAGTYTRPNYYFVKTAGCDLLGHVNSAIVKKVGEIFDNGITFWLNYAMYGDYTHAKEGNVPVSPNNGN